MHFVRDTRCGRRSCHEHRQMPNREPALGRRRLRPSTVADVGYFQALSSVHFLDRFSEKVRVQDKTRFSAYTQMLYIYLSL